MKPRIAVLFGGASSEYSVSLQSAHAVLTHLDAAKYDVLPIGITRAGDWFRYTGSLEAIARDEWQRCAAALYPVAVSPSRGERCLWELPPEGLRRTEIDLAFPVLHGKNGEDGTVQGLFELAGIPIVGCGTLSSALCMDKARAHSLVQAAGIAVPHAQLFRKLPSEAELEAWNYPVFVKPVRGGSSLGITYVQSVRELYPALRMAFEYDSEALIEEAIHGFEVGCAVLGTETLTVGRVDEIELAHAFFDYTEKYTLRTAAIHMPARIDGALEAEIQRTACAIYRILGCAVFARVDLFLTPEGRIVFNEVNTIPGFTAHSRYPNMLRGIGLPFPEILDRMIEESQKTENTKEVAFV